jgi:hypothetical protein
VTTELPLAEPGDIGLTWITGWTGFWVSIGQWIAGDGGRWPWSRIRMAKKIIRIQSGKKAKFPRGFPTHAFTFLPDGMIFEAQPGGAVISPVARYADKPILIARLPLTDDQRAHVPLVVMGLLGTPYSFLDYVYLGLWRLGIRPEWLKEAVRRSGHMICSQSADKVAELLGFHLFTDGRLNQDVTPGDLFELFEAKGWWDVAA